MSTKALGRRVVVAGWAITPRGQGFEVTWRELLAQAFYNALAQTGLSPLDIQAGSVAYNERTVSEAALGTHAVDALGLRMDVPMVPVSHACAGGGIALYNVWNMIASGVCDVGVVLSFQCSDAYDNFECMNPIGNYSDYDFLLGYTHMQYGFLRDKLYMEKYGYDLRPSAQWAYQCHEYARKNPDAALYGKPMPSMGELLDPGPEGSRARSATNRGPTATATILVSEDKAESMDIAPIYCWVSFAFRPPYIGNHFYYQGDPGHEAYDIAEQPAVMAAARKVYALAGITPEDIDIVQVHDLTGFEGIMSLEGLGLVPVGEGGKFVLEGGTSPSGRYPACTHGGGIAFGHTSVGSDFQAGFIESCLQLKGMAGERQIKDARVAVVQAYGTHHSLDVVSVLRR